MKSTTLLEAYVKSIKDKEDLSYMLNNKMWPGRTEKMRNKYKRRLRQSTKSLTALEKKLAQQEQKLKIYDALVIESNQILEQMQLERGIYQKQINAYMAHFAAEEPKPVYICSKCHELCNCSVK